jgi:N-carbamoyl-L-amino-acid hydrolase
MEIQIDQERLIAELEMLASFSDVEGSGVTRIVFSPPDLKAREWLKGMCREAALNTREDAVGNIFARWIGAEPELASIGTGSHIDAIPCSGQYDGTVGVLAGLEAIRALRCSGFRPRRSIELLVFTSEEPTRFGVGCLGSRLLSGSLDATSAGRLRDSDGKTLERVRQEAGFQGALEEVTLPANYYRAFIELHIEQGPLLEREQIPIGIVTGIAGPATLRIHIVGQGGHAGAVLMPDRKDAFCAAAEMVLAIEAQAVSSGSSDTVATVGTCAIYPGAVNSIPNSVDLQVDVRDTAEQRRDKVLKGIIEACRNIGERRGVAVSIETVNADPPAESATTVVEALIASCNENRLAFKKLVSRAYHDSLFMARIAPTGMLFIPCQKGISHTPEEYTSPEHIENGTRVLACALARLSG